MLGQEERSAFDDQNSAVRIQLKSVMQTGRHLGMQTMNDHLFDLVKARVVDVKEAFIKAHDKAGFREMLQKARIPIDPALLRGEE